MLLQVFSLISCFAAVTASNPCHGGGILDPSGQLCYLFGAKSSSFGDAEKACRSYSGYNLAVITTMVDNNFLSKFAKEHSYEDMYIGATDITADGSWQWVDGTKMSFVNWAPAPKVGSCAVMRASDGKWLRDTCDDKRSFICYGPAAGGSTTKKPKHATTPPITNSEVQFLYFVGDAEFLGDPNNHTKIGTVYNKERDFMKAVGDHMFDHNVYPDQGLQCSVWADQSWYGWANYQQQFKDGYSERKKGFDGDIMHLNFTEETYEMNNITTAITALKGFHWYPTPSESGYTTLIFFTGNQDFTDVPSLFDPWPYIVDEILVVLMNGSPMPVPDNNPRVNKVSISMDFNKQDLKAVTDALKCH